MLTLALAGYGVSMDAHPGPGWLQCVYGCPSWSWLVMVCLWMLTSCKELAFWEGMLKVQRQSRRKGQRFYKNLLHHPFRAVVNAALTTLSLNQKAAGNKHFKSNRRKKPGPSPLVS